MHMTTLKQRLAKAAYISTAAASMGFAKVAGAVTAADYTPTQANSLLLGDADPLALTVNTINWVLGLLSLVAVVLILIGGFRWMVAGGNEEKIEGAKKMLIAALIGLVIILSSWGIATFVIGNLLNFSNA